MDHSDSGEVLEVSKQVAKSLMWPRVTELDRQALGGTGPAETRRLKQRVAVPPELL